MAAATAAEAGVGVVEALVVAPAAEAPVVLVEEAVAIVGQGLQGDRYADGTGTFALWPAGECTDPRRRRRPRHASTAGSTTAATSSCEEPISTRSSAASSCSARCAVAAAGCANRAPTSIASTAAESYDRSYTAVDCAQTLFAAAPSASATSSHPTDAEPRRANRAKPLTRRLPRCGKKERRSYQFVGRMRSSARLIAPIRPQWHGARRTPTRTRRQPAKRFRLRARTRSRG